MPCRFPAVPLFFSAALSIVAGPGCVLQSTYDAKVAALDGCKQNLAKSQSDLAKTQGDLARSEQTGDSCQKGLTACQSARQGLEGQLGDLQMNLKATSGELADVRREHDAAQKRLAEYQKLAAKLKAMTDAGTISVSIRHGKMVVNLPAGVLFDTGSAEVKQAGRDTLKQVAAALEQLSERDFLIAGDTDNQPIHTHEFRSNWELSTARAVSVVRILQDAGVPPQHLAAAGYAEYDPIADNSTREGQALNRRIEIILMPNLEELPSLPSDLSAPSPASGATH